MLSISSVTFEHPVLVTYKKERFIMSKKKKGNKGNGNGCHHEVSPMGHATRTKSREEKRQQAERRQRQKGWA